MAVRHEFGGEKQSSGSNEQSEPRNPLNPKVGRSENIDTLVSRFLDELSGISTEIAHDGNPAAASPPEPPAGESKAAPRFRPADDGSTASDPDLEKISEEIERSLAELESLSTRAVVTEDSPEPDAPAKPAAVELPVSEARTKPTNISPPVDPDEQAWNRIELFRSRVSARRRWMRLSFGWFFAGAIFLGILSISVYFFFNSDSGKPKGVKQLHGVEATKSAQISGDVQKPAAPDGSPGETVSAGQSKPAPPVKAPVQGAGRNRPVPGLTRSAEISSSRTPAASTAGQDLRRPTQNTNGAPAAERPQTAAPTAPPSEPPSAAVSPPPVASAPKPEPTVPSGTTNNAGGSNTAAVAAAPVPETAPAAPKIAPAAEGEVGAAAAPKSGVALMAEVLTRVQPTYPAIARAQRIGGKVEVEAEINEKGDVVRAKAISGPNLLRISAEQALMKWKFKPASVNGVSVPSKARITVSFSVQ